MALTALAPRHHQLAMPALVRWRPSIDLLAVVLTWLGVVGALSAATYLATAERGGLYFLLYALLAAGVLGVGAPLAWMVVVRHRSPADLGLTLRHWRLSLLLQLAFGAAQYVMTLGAEALPPFADLLPLLSLVLTIGLFEAVFWRGWVFLRLEEAFGLVPALVLGPALYAVYHIGYGMRADEMAVLFVVGLVYAAIFRLTRSVLILWPLLQPMGQFFNLLKEPLPLPPIAVLGFGEVLLLMGAMIWLAHRAHRGHWAQRAFGAAAGSG